MHSRIRKMVDRFRGGILQGMGARSGSGAVRVGGGFREDGVYFLEDAHDLKILFRFTEDKIGMQVSHKNSKLRLEASGQALKVQVQLRASATSSVLAYKTAPREVRS